MFGDEDNPIRCSSIPMLLRCPLRAEILYRGDATDESGEAADTGSAVHKAVESWHDGCNDSEAVNAMREALAEYPRADLADAEKNFRAYIKDPRNQKAEIVSNETEIGFTLPPHEADRTGQLIHFKGRLDQVRRGGLRLEVWDIKTSKRPGYEIAHEYAPQLAAYCYGAEQLLGKPVHPGGFILTRNYLKRGVDPAAQPPGVFFSAPFTRADVSKFMDAARFMVGVVRNGQAWAGPGLHCTWCPAGGLDTCLRLKK